MMTNIIMELEAGDLAGRDGYYIRLVDVDKKIDARGLDNDPNAYIIWSKQFDYIDEFTAAYELLDSLLDAFEEKGIYHSEGERNK